MVLREVHSVPEMPEKYDTLGLVKTEDMFNSHEKFDVQSQENTKSGLSRKALILGVFCVCVAFTVGILIGHYAISKDSSDSGGGTTEAPQSGVFLPGVPEAIIRDADLTVTERLLTEIDGQNIREYLKNLVEVPHVAGTPLDFEQADMLRQFWLDNGFDVAVTTPYDILLSYPDDNIPNKVRVMSDDHVIFESADWEQNLTAEERPWEFPFPYLGYSGNGTVKGDLVYANRATRGDFLHLASLNISVSGCIVLARYGGGGRSSKVRMAEENGAIGVILYADPADYVAPWATEFYPDTIWIPPTATPRGSIFMGTGDPLTPGYPSIASAYRYNESDEEANLPKIPALPIGYDFAELLLREIGGREAPEDWSGRLLSGSQYNIGPGFRNSSLSVELRVFSTNQRKVAYNAFGLIRGEVEPDRYVMLGNHRDSWVLGAIDPSSGTATMMELSRVMGNLVKNQEWRPRRSILFCSWGAEEFGLIGSTEWIEENRKTLDFRSIAYINMDIAVTGNYSIRGLGSPPIFSAMYNAAKKIPNPRTEERDQYPSVYDAWLARKTLKDPDTGNNLTVPEINSPGAGSDYGTFQQRAGITCADFRYDQNYAGEGVLFYPLYHTGYETLHAVETLIDPGLVYHATIGKLSGELLRDLADSKILPFNMSDYAMFLKHYNYRFRVNITDVEIQEYNLDTAELDRVIQLYEDNAAAFHLAVNSINVNNPFELRRVNDQMMQIERTFLDPAALNPGVELLKRHLVHGSVEFDGIPGASFPGLEDNLFKVRLEDTSTNIRALQHHFSVLVSTIQEAANSLKDSTAFLRESL